MGTGAEKKDQPGKDKVAAETSNNGDAPQDANAMAAQTPGGSTETPRREGDHTSNLERPGEAVAVAEQPAADPNKDATTVVTTDQTDQKGNNPDAKMTPEKAEQLLRILQGDEKILPAGQTESPQGNNDAGRDW